MENFNRIQTASLLINNKTYPVLNGVNTIGRNKTAAVNIKHLNVSQNQALIILVNDTQHYIADMNSSNGTFIHNTRMIPFKLYELTNKAEIKFADVSAVYLKLLSSTTNEYLQQALNASEMTQNMTQNFYASNTQLIFNKDESIHNSGKSNINSFHIHEAPTSIINNPSKTITTQVENNHNKLQDSVVEPLPADIHEAPTQVFTFKKHLSSQLQEINMHDAPTQVFVHVHSNIGNYDKPVKESMPDNYSLQNNLENVKESSENQSSDSNTQVMTVEEKQDIANRVNIKNDSIPEVSLISETPEANTKNDQNLQEDQKNSTSTIENKKNNIIHDSQDPSTSGLKEYDESFLDSSKKRISIDYLVEETVIENTNSNDSIDFLVIESTQNQMMEYLDKNPPKDNDLSSMESDFTHKRKKKIQKLLSSETDSDKDDEHSQGVVKMIKIPILKLPDFSESQTDIESTQDIGYKKKPLKPISDSSDSETDMENTPKNVETTPKWKPKKISFSQSDSETDCDEVTLDKPHAKVTASEVSKNVSSHDLKNNKKDETCELDDTNCIPPTQDAFAEALGYNHYQSSEESFKLGLTELMNLTENDDFEKHEITDQTSHVEIVVNSTDKKDSVNSNENVDDVSVKETAVVPKKYTFKKKSLILDRSLSTILSVNNKGGSTTANENDEIDSKSTQLLKNSKENDSNTTRDDVFMQPTQLLKNSKENDSKTTQDDNNFVQPTQLLKNSKENDSKTNQDDDAFVQPTQDDDVYVQPTQLLKNSRENDSKINQDDDVFVQPTQLLKNLKENVSNTTQDDDVFVQPTQLLKYSDNECLNAANKICLFSSEKAVNQKICKENDLKSTQDDIFLQPTQLLNNSEKSFAKSVDKTDWFKQPTQIINFNENPTSKGLNTQDDIYLVSTQVIQESSMNKFNDAPNTQEDLYAQDTQKIENFTRDSSASKCQENKDIYMLPTQEIVNKDDLTETELEFQNIKHNVKLDFTTEVKRPANPLLWELDDETNQKCDSATELSDQNSIEKKIPEKNINISDTENNSSEVPIDLNKTNKKHLEEIGTFIKPLPLKKLPKEPDSKEDAESLSQIEAFIKKPVISSKSNKTKCTTKTSKDEGNRSETLSQIAAFVNEPLTKMNDAGNQTLLKFTKENQTVIEAATSVSSQDPKRVSRRISRRRSSNTPIENLQEKSNGKKLKSIKEENVTKNSFDESLKDIEDETDKKDGRNIRSDVDQSFALLESKSSKVKKKLSNDSLLDDIKVTVTSHRRSMSTAENLKNKEELVVPIKKSKLSGSTSISSTSNAKVPSKDSKAKPKTEEHATNKILRTRKSRLACASSEDNKTTKKAKPNDESTINENDSTASSDSTLEAPRKTTQVKKSRVLSNSKKDENSVSVKDKSIDTSKMTETANDKIKKLNDTANKKNNQKQISECIHDFIQTHVSTSSSSSSRSSSRTTKRHATDSSEEYSCPSTPVKLTRTSKTLSNLNSDGNHSSTASELIVTPRRGRNAPKTEVLTSSVERLKRKLKPKVVFTMLDSPQLESFIRHLGGSIVESVDYATVLITQNVKRSQKLLTAVAQGKPICAPNWVNDSKKKNEFLDPWDYILIDKEAETKWNFSLKESLKRAENKKLLFGYLFQIMVTNAVEVLKAAIEASGGKCVTKFSGTNQTEKFVIVALPENKTKYNKIRKQYPDVIIIEPEAVFDGVLRQELRFSMHILK